MLMEQSFSANFARFRPLSLTNHKRLLHSYTLARPFPVGGQQVFNDWTFKPKWDKVETAVCPKPLGQAHSRLPMRCLKSSGKLHAVNF